EGAIKAWNELGGLKKDFKFNQYMQTMGVAIGHTILRTLTRRAVLRTGVQPGEIDYVTQMYALKMYTANNRQSHKMLQVRFLHDMCQLVNRYKMQANTSLIRSTIKYIEMNLSNDLSLDVLAENTGTSKAHLSRRFKEEKGLTINQFIAKVRMEKAAELLISSRLSIQDISTYVGYLDGNYFVKVFKKQYGMPPSIYRKQHA
ncbi:MAG: helix-turn-helix domain-containing protein, partial [Sphaerochaetaceae bacterium]